MNGFDGDDLCVSLKRGNLAQVHSPPLCCGVSFSRCGRSSISWRQHSSQQSIPVGFQIACGSHISSKIGGVEQRVMNGLGICSPESLATVPLAKEAMDSTLFLAKREGRGPKPEIACESRHALAGTSRSLSLCSRLPDLSRLGRAQSMLCHPEEDTRRKQ